MIWFYVVPLGAAVLAYAACLVLDPAARLEGAPRALVPELATVSSTPKRAPMQVPILPRPGALDAAPASTPIPTETVKLAVNLATGDVVSVRNLHDPIRKVAGDPEKAARKVAKATVAELRAARPAPAALPSDGPARSNKTLPQVVDALRRPGGVTLAELTAAAGWRAPFELQNLRIAARKLGFAFADDGAAGDGRRYRIAEGA